MSGRFNAGIRFTLRTMIPHDQVVQDDIFETCSHMSIYDTSLGLSGLNASSDIDVDSGLDFYRNLHPRVSLLGNMVT